MNNLTFKVIDVMKKCKDTVNNQLTSAEKTALIACVASTGATHCAISVPMDSQATFTGNGVTPSPRTISAETQDWCDIIHAAGLGVIHRGTFCGAENIWSAAFYDGGVSTGTAASAATDGTSTLCGKYYQYLWTNVGRDHVANGDVFAPIPEGTTHAFDGHYFWAAGSQANYADVYAKFHTITSSFASAIGKTVSFMSHNNFSEVNSGWIPASLFTDCGAAGADYYGQSQGAAFVKPSDYVTDWATQYTNKAVVTQWGEWGDLSNAIPTNIKTIEDRMSYLIRFYTAVRDSLVNNGKMNYFNYWGGWDAQNTSLFIKTGTGASAVYALNARGKILANFFKGDGGSGGRSPVVTSGNSDSTYTF